MSNIHALESRAGFQSLAVQKSYPLVFENKHQCYLKPSYDPRTPGMFCAWGSPIFVLSRPPMLLLRSLLQSRITLHSFISLWSVLLHKNLAYSSKSRCDFLFFIFFLFTEPFSAPSLDAVQHSRAHRAAKLAHGTSLCRR